MTSFNKEQIIIGIDPGTRVTGYGIVAISGREIKTLDYGCIRPPAKALLSDRYFIIYESLHELLEKYNPSQMAIETQFVNKNAQSALKLGIAQGVAIISAKKYSMKVFGYAPKTVKRAVTGTGNASKEQLQGAIARHLGLRTLPKPYDAADALAIAICHAHGMTNMFQQKLKQEL